MRTFIRAAALSLTLCMLTTSGLAATKATPTPPPVEVTRTVQQDLPEKITQLLNLAYHEWEELGGKTLKKSNKYTKWRNNYEWGWCGGFITWCMLQLDVPMERLADMPEAKVEGVVHVKEASVGKLLRGYQKMNRSTNIPQRGFLVVYGVRKSANKTVHIGLVYDVQDLGGGKYRLTTIEGNMSNRVKMYVHDYDANAADRTKNLSTVPETERVINEETFFSYKLQDKNWYVNVFLMPWVPGETPVQQASVTEIPPYAYTMPPQLLPATPTPAPTPTLPPPSVQNNPVRPLVTPAPVPVTTPVPGGQVTPQGGGVFVTPMMPFSMGN